MLAAQLVDPETVGLCPIRLERVRSLAARYVDSGKIPCALTAVMRRGELAFLDVRGAQSGAQCGDARQPEAPAKTVPLAEDSIFRI